MVINMLDINTNGIRASASLIFETIPAGIYLFKDNNIYEIDTKKKFQRRLPGVLIFNFEHILHKLKR